MNESRTVRVDGRVPHTVISLPSGRTIAYGDNPDPTNGKPVAAKVQAALSTLLEAEMRASALGGTLPREVQAEALTKVAAAKSAIEATGCSDSSVTWGRVVVDRIHRLVFDIAAT